MLRRLALSCLTLMLFVLYGCSSDNREVSNGGTGTYNQSSACIGCHTGKISPVTGNRIVFEWLSSAHNTGNGAACDSCHINNGHPNGGSILKAVPDTQCSVSCHTVSSLGPPHFANFTTSLAAQYVSESFPAEVRCRQCHNPHNVSSLLQYNRDWADSGHGDTNYVPGNANASSVNSHYPWTTADRDACSKCHTTTGNLKHTVGGATVLTTNAVSTVPPPGTTTITGGPLMSNNTQNETLMCSICHNDYSWTRRAIGARTLEYTFDPDLVIGGGSDPIAGAAPPTTDGPAPPAAVVMPDVGESNLCLTCHSGRGNFQSRRSTRFEGHHAPTGADIYAERTHVGFEFVGRDYTKPAFFAHDSIGVSEGDGPCVTCHMKTTKSHTWEVVTKDAGGVITAINSQGVCNGCHGTSMTANVLEQNAVGYREAGKLLQDYLANTVPNYTGAAITLTSANVNTVHVNTYGAVQNSLYPTEDPGGYTHNSFYVKRLIFDSIDWLDNHVFDGTITINAASYPNAATWYNADTTTGVATRP